MIYAQKEHPEVYKGILGNTEFKKVYAAVNSKYNDLIDQFQLRMNQLQTNLATEDNTTGASEHDGYYFIGRKGVGLFVEEREKLKSELAKPDFIKMDQILKSGI